MQTTNTYQFKLIENTDDFSPAPINENTQSIEKHLSELRAATDLKARISVGSYTGTGQEEAPTTVTLGFAPTAVVVWAGIRGKNSTQGEFAPYFYCGAATADDPLGEILTLTQTGFTVRSTFITIGSDNYYEYPKLNDAMAYNYLAVG